MSTVLTELDVMNLALDHLRNTPMSTATDTTPQGRWMQRNYDHVRDMCLRKHFWNFATEIASLSADPQDPPFGWNYRYLLPSDCLKLAPLRYLGEWEGRMIPHELIGRYIHTDLTAPLKIRYIKRVENPAEWDPLFAEFVSCAIAFRASHFATGKESSRQNLAQMTKDAFEDAIRSDGMEGTMEEPDADDVIAARYSGYSSRRYP